MNRGEHFKLGLFVVAAVTLLVTFLLSLGVLQRFEPSVTVETYFNEDIRGLTVGAPVRFRGIRAGAVTSISFADKAYPEIAEQENVRSGLIRVVVDVEKSIFLAEDDDDIRTEIERAVRFGLRFRLNDTGLGGPTYVEADLVDPDSAATLNPTWNTTHTYIPSSPSRAVEIISSLAAVLTRLEDSGLIDSFDRFVTVAETAGRLLDDVEQTGVINAADDTLAELRQATRTLRDAVEDARVDAILSNTSSATASLDQLLADNGDFPRAARRVEAMATNLDDTARALTDLTRAIHDAELIDNAAVLADSLAETAPALANAAEALESAMTRVDRIARTNERPLADAVRALRDASLTLDALLQDLRANPSQLLADPPPTERPRSQQQNGDAP